MQAPGPPRPTEGPQISEKVVSVTREDSAVPTTSSGRLHESCGIRSYFQTRNTTGTHPHSSRTHKGRLRAGGLQIRTPAPSTPGKQQPRKLKVTREEQAGPKHSRLHGEQQTESLPLGGSCSQGSPVGGSSLLSLPMSRRE